MKEELGKWLMDISKYITTAVVITALIGGIQNQSVMIVASVSAAAVTLTTGLILVNKTNKDKNKNKK